MIRVRYGMLAVLIFGVLQTVPAEEPGKPRVNMQTYLDQLQVKLDHTARRTNQPGSGSSSVVGLRGSKQEPASKQLYWKGKTGPAPISLDEVKAFRSALEQVKAGQTSQAVASLESFGQKYPYSALKPDADETLRLLNEKQ